MPLTNNSENNSDFPDNFPKKCIKNEYLVGDRVLKVSERVCKMYKTGLQSPCYNYGQFYSTLVKWIHSPAIGPILDTLTGDRGRIEISSCKWLFRRNRMDPKKSMGHYFERRILCKLLQIPDLNPGPRDLNPKTKNLLMGVGRVPKLWGPAGVINTIKDHGWPSRFEIILITASTFSQNFYHRLAV